MASQHRISVVLDQELFEAFDQIAKIEGKSRSAVVRDYLEIGRESITAVAASLAAINALRDDERERVRDRLDRLAGAVQASEEAVLGALEEASTAARETVASTAAAAAKLADASRAEPDPRVCNTGVHSEQGGNVEAFRPRKGGPS